MPDFTQFVLPEQRCTQCENVRPQDAVFFRYLAAQDRFHPWCRECERANNRVRGAARRAVGRARATFTHRRRFGVEIEFFGIRRSVAAEALRAAGLRVRAGYAEPVSRRSWRLKTDGSVNGAGTGEGSGLELVSPPLKGAAGLRDAKLAFDALKAAGARVDTSCGLHLHLDMNDVRGEGIKWFARSWVNNQRLIQYLISNSRRDGRYCRALTEEGVARIERAQGSRHLSGPRYSAINVNAFPAHGTVEIRCHQGTVDFRKFDAWLRLTLGMLEVGIRETAGIAPKAALRDLLTEIDLPQPTADYLMRRARTFGAPAHMLEAPVAEEVAV